LKSVIGTQAAVNKVKQVFHRTTQQLSAEIPVSIIVAEDNIINQKLIQRMLRSLGYEPTIVGTGLEVLSSLEHAPCDLVFMDVQMPEMDGLEATQKIRQKYGTNAGPKIVAMTAFALAGDKEKCLQAGMDDYLSKPFVSEQVASMIRKWGGHGWIAPDNHPTQEERTFVPTSTDIQERLNELEQETERSFVKELVGIFFEEAPANLQTLKEALGAKDAKTIEQFAHKLKGGSLNLGAKKLSQLFESMEALARNNVAIVPDSLIADIDRELDGTIKYLRDYVAALG
jgi:CheY-like chemotaxis protein